MDADFIGGWIAAHILADQGNVEEAQDVIVDSVGSLFQRFENDELQPLILEGNEILWAGISIAFIIISITAGSWMTGALEAELVAGITLALAAGLGVTILSLAAILVGVLLGQISELAFLFALVPVVLSLIFYILISIPWYKAWIAGALTVAITNPLISFINAASSALSIIVVVAGVLSDWLDSGDGGQATTFLD